MNFRFLFPVKRFEAKVFFQNYVYYYKCNFSLNVNVTFANVCSSLFGSAIKIFYYMSIHHFVYKLRVLNETALFPKVLIRLVKKIG